MTVHHMLEEPSDDEFSDYGEFSEPLKPYDMDSTSLRTSTIGANISVSDKLCALSVRHTDDAASDSDLGETKEEVRFKGQLPGQSKEQNM
jgi:hypothetical protein